MPLRRPALSYRLPWLAAGVHPGSHRARVAGAGDQLRGAVPLVQGRDARRLDLRASVTDPFGRPWVREFRQRSRVPVVLAADLSSSMRHAGRSPRLGLVADFARALADSAFGRGDPFGFIGCAAAPRTALMLPPVVSRQAGERVVRQLQAWNAMPRPPEGAEGLLRLAAWLPRQRSLVFLLSDLYLDEALFDSCLARLAHHDVVVLMLADSAERLPPARWGLARLADVETGEQRLVFLRPGLAARLAAAQAARVQAAQRIAQRRGAALLVAEDTLDFQQITRHFMARGGA